MKKKDTLYLVDAVVPMIVDAPTILVTSPRRIIYDDFCRKRSSNGTPLYMPIWRWDELLKLHEFCFSHELVTTLKKVYTRWGGIPREVMIEVNTKLIVGNILCRSK